MDDLLTSDLTGNVDALCKNAQHSPLLHTKPAGNGVRFFDRSADSAFSSQYDTSPRSSTGSSNPSDKVGLSDQVPIIIGDRVYVGPSRLSGTVAYMGPTHFATGDMVGVVLDKPKGRHDGTAYGIRYFQCPPRCGVFCRLDNLKHMDAGKHFPNCRIRTGALLLPSNLHTNGLDYRRVSLTKPSQFTRSSSARFNRQHPQFSSVIGAMGSYARPTFDHFDSSGMKRSKSDRFKSSRPQWKPPGSPAPLPEVQPKSMVRSQTLPRSTKRAKLLVSFDLNASHDLAENNSVISCPSLRHAIRNSPWDVKSHSTANLTVSDRRTPNYLKGSLVKQPERPSRARTWSPNRFPSSRVRSRSVGSTDRQQNNRSLKPAQPLVRRPQLSMTYQDPDSPGYSPGSTVSLLRPNIPKSLSADIVIACAQDRLVELQNKVVEAYRARTEVTQAIEEQRRRYKELCRVYEQYKSGAIRRPIAKHSSSAYQLDAMRAQLATEYEKTKGLLIEMKQLSLTLDDYATTSVAESNHLTGSTQKQTRHSASPSATVVQKHPLNAIIEQDAEQPNEPDPPTKIEVKVTSPERVDCQIERLRTYSAHQRQCDQLLCKLVVCRQSVKDKLTELVPPSAEGKEQPEDSEKQEQNKSSSDNTADKSTEPHSDLCSVLDSVLHNQKKLKEQENGRTKQLTIELNVLEAEISHLSSSTVVEAHEAVHRYQHAQAEIRRAVSQIGELQECNSALRHTVDSARFRMEHENSDQMIYLRNSLRIHQLKQMEHKAKRLYDEQTVLIEEKSRDLAKVVNEFNLVSQIWASERELKLYANQQLKDRLAALSNGLSEIQRPTDTSKHRSDPVSTEPSMDQLPLSNSLLSALFKEIRRLQTRSVTLVDALNSLNSGKCSSAQLTQIRMLVHRSQPAVSSSKSPKTPTRRNTRRPKAQTEHFSNGFSSGRFDHNSHHADGVRTQFDLMSKSQYLTNPSRTASEERTSSGTRLDPSMNYADARTRRRRPVSFYLNRTSNSVLGEVIQEAEEETAESP